MLRNNDHLRFVVKHLYVIIVTTLLLDIRNKTISNADENCPVDWMFYRPNKVCLRAFIQLAEPDDNWSLSNIFCQERAINNTSYSNSRLAIITDKEMLDFIHRFVVPKQDRGVSLWINLKYDPNFKSFTWSDGRIAEFQKWTVHFPNSEKLAKCGLLQAGEFQNQECEFCGHRPLCETSPNYVIPISCDKENGGCQHICISGDGYRNCSCSVGYTLTNEVNCTKQMSNYRRRTRHGVIFLAILSPLMLTAAGTLICMGEKRREGDRERNKKKIKHMKAAFAGSSSETEEYNDEETSSEESEDEDDKKSVSRSSVDIPESAVDGVPSAKVRKASAMSEGDEEKKTGLGKFNFLKETKKKGQQPAAATEKQPEKAKLTAEGALLNHNTSS